MHTLEVKIIDWGLFLTVPILHPTSFLSFVSTPHIMSPPVTEVNRIKGVFTNTNTHTRHKVVHTEQVTCLCSPCELASMYLYGQMLLCVGPKISSCICVCGFAPLRSLFHKSKYRAMNYFSSLPIAETDNKLCVVVKQ